MPRKQLRQNVFVSYSHEDTVWLERLKTHLAPYLRGEKLILWDDTKIRPGQDWASEIKNAIATARVAVLLVTPAFLASDYVNDVELPAILERAKEDLAVLWIPVKASAYTETPLAHIQAAHDPSQPLAKLTSARQDEALVAIAKRISATMDVNSIGNSLRLIDDFTPELEAFVEGRPEPTAPGEFRSRAEQVANTLNLVEPGYTSKLIDAQDLEQLDGNAQMLIRSYERTMKELFERWTELKPKRVAVDPVIRDGARSESDLIRRELCAELTELLRFIESLGMSLQDHYMHVRFICQS
jgi:hypothetical protein